MKKIITFSAIAVLLVCSEARAQCSGGNVSVTNVTVTQSGTVVSYSFDWQYVQGNASLEPVFYCNGAVFHTLPCIPWLKDSAAGVHTISGSFSNSCVGTVTMDVRVWTSNQCNGTYCLILPVKINFFAANRNASSVKLVWQTASEQNNAGFYAERNVNGTWETVAFVPTQAVGGNSSTDLNYTWTDPNSAKTMSLYRIKQVDIDGRFTYSKVNAVAGLNQELGGITIFPNPSIDGKVTMAFKSNALRDVTIIDLSTGRITRWYPSVTGGSLQVDGLTTGIYGVRVVENGTSVTGKIVVQ